MPTDTLRTPPSEQTVLKEAIKEAVAEVLTEQRDLLQDIVGEALEELALMEALREVEAHERRYGRRAAWGQVEAEA